MNPCSMAASRPWAAGDIERERADDDEAEQTRAGGEQRKIAANTHASRVGAHLKPR